MKWRCLRRIVNSANGKITFYIKYCRQKEQGAVEEMEQMVVGEVNIDTIDAYANCFTPEERNPEKRLFRYLIFDKAERKIRATKNLIGKHWFAKSGARVATQLEKDNPQLYTTHRFRRNTITRLADAGLSLVTIRCLTGHKSDGVVEMVSHAFQIGRIFISDIFILFKLNSTLIGLILRFSLELLLLQLAIQLPATLFALILILPLLLLTAIVCHGTASSAPSPTCCS